MSVKTEITEKLTGIPTGKIRTAFYSGDSDGAPLIELRDAECSGRGLVETYAVFDGIELSFFTLCADKISFKHEPMKGVMEINHCHNGRAGLAVNDGNVYLGAGDLSLNTMDKCADAEMSLPLGYYEGITVCIDLNKLTTNPPDIIKDTGITGELLYDKFCKAKAFTTLTGGAKTDGLFAALYDAPQSMRMPYLKIKTQELLLYLYEMEFAAEQKYPYPPDQIDTVKKIHELLTQNLDKRYTIEDLSKMFLMNTTTLKAAFKSVYGVSIAAHVKEHRLEKAAFMLCETDESISEIARAVGYESQSKFTSAFREAYKMLPTDYRKQKTPPQKDIL